MKHQGASMTKRIMSLNLWISTVIMLTIPLCWGQKSSVVNSEKSTQSSKDFTKTSEGSDKKTEKLTPAQKKELDDFIQQKLAELEKETKNKKFPASFDTNKIKEQIKQLDYFSMKMAKELESQFKKITPEQKKKAQEQFKTFYKSLSPVEKKELKAVYEKELGVSGEEFDKLVQ